MAERINYKVNEQWVMPVNCSHKLQVATQIVYIIQAFAKHIAAQNSIGAA